jgi:transglutaminase-like putative cysteine protease
MAGEATAAAARDPNADGPFGKARTRSSRQFAQAQRVNPWVFFQELACSHQYFFRAKNAYHSLVILGLGMTILTIRHTTTYRYRQPVGFGEHRMMLRPIDCHDQRVLKSKLQITPKPSNIRCTSDVFGNCVALAGFVGRAQMLQFESTVWLEHFPKVGVDREIENSARTYPFSYRAEDMPDLVPFLERQCLDEDHELDRWLRGILDLETPTNTYALLIKLNRTIKETFRYVPRHEKGVQEPLLTLKLRRGSCRDFAMLLIAAARSLGMAARFVSGYLRLAEDDNVIDNDEEEQGGNMHAWAQVYLPGPGWVDFDPASGTVGSHDLIRVAVVRAPWQAIPLQGTWTGFPSDFLDMTVKVSVESADQAERPARRYLSVVSA